MADEFAVTGCNTIVRAYAYTGFDPLVKDSEGWAQAIARFNPTTTTNDCDDSDNGDSPMDVEDERDEERMRQESIQLVREVLDRHFTKSREILLVIPSHACSHTHAPSHAYTHTLT